MATVHDPHLVSRAAGPIEASVTVPGSKSITNRALVCAALAAGRSRLTGALVADDTEAMITSLRSLGFDVVAHDGAAVEVEGSGGRIPADGGAVDTRQSGTTSRFLLPILALGSGPYDVDAHPQMRARPMGETFEALRRLGLHIEERGAPGHLPVTVETGSGLPDAGVLPIRGDVSSQFLSGLLLIGPCLPEGLRVQVTTPLVSEPYVRLTIAVMEAFGATVERDGTDFVVAAGGYRGTSYEIEADASAASYPLAAAAACGGRVTVEGIGTHALQGDAAFADVLEAMGALVSRTDRTTTVEARPGALRGGSFDLGDLSDTAQTLAAIAPLAAEPVTVHGIGFIRHKEIDRLTAVATELRRCGIRVDLDDDGWTIHPGEVRPATIQTSDDHRMAMSFGVLGLAVGGLSIADPMCVAKTFPGYWDLLSSLQRSTTAR